MGDQVVFIVTHPKSSDSGIILRLGGGGRGVGGGRTIFGRSRSSQRKRKGEQPINYFSIGEITKF